jgi:hypothetical protein
LRRMQRGEKAERTAACCGSVVAHMRQQFQNERDRQQQQRCDGRLDCVGVLLLRLLVVTKHNCVFRISRCHLLSLQLLCMCLPVNVSAVCAHDIAATCGQMARSTPWAAATTAQVR